MAQINHPDYYMANDCNIEAIDYIEAYEFNFNLGNVIKYVTRAGHKPDENALTALRKAQWYLNREINRLAPDLLIAETENKGGIFRNENSIADK